MVGFATRIAEADTAMRLNSGQFAAPALAAVAAASDRFEEVARPAVLAIGA